MKTENIICLPRQVGKVPTHLLAKCIVYLFNKIKIRTKIKAPLDGVQVSRNVTRPSDGYKTHYWTLFFKVLQA